MSGGQQKVNFALLHILSLSLFSFTSTIITFISIAMQHPLPIKPSFLGQSSLTPTPLYPTSLPTLPLPNQNAIASSFKTTLSTTSLKSSPSLKECSICSQPPKYTCPRCSLKTCSLSCTKTHKAEYSCSGTRDPTSFVTLKEFKQGDWGDDFRWLEDGRRKLCAWGEGIKEGEVDLVTGMKRGGGKDQRGGGGRLGGKDTRNGNGNDKKGKGRSKSEILQMELRRRGVWMCLMPDGMGKKKLNQSGWNPKYVQCIGNTFFTFEFVSLSII